MAHGRLRGVRVVPEFDLPAHMASWAQGVPALITDCPSVNPHPEWPRYYSPADVTQPDLYEVIDTILSQLSKCLSRQQLACRRRRASLRVLVGQSWGDQVQTRSWEHDRPRAIHIFHLEVRSNCPEARQEPHRLGGDLNRGRQCHQQRSIDNYPRMAGE